MSAPVPAGFSPVALDQAEARRRLWETACNVAIALVFLRFAAFHGTALVHTLRLSSLLLLTKASVDVYFFLTRSMPKGVSIYFYDWFIGIAGTFAVLMFQPAAHSTDHWTGQALQFAGMVLQVLGILSLNRSIGIVAANRGVKTSGMYRFVRHPLYFSYTVAYAGYVINHPSNWNMLIYSISLTLWVLRLVAEERFLMKDPEYQAYAQQVRSRLIPGIF
jgi:protein-S-isoprenylcysteine O-methyltransferase Ste14